MRTAEKTHMNLFEEVDTGLDGLGQGVKGGSGG